MKILVAADHAGFELKNTIVNYLKDESFDVEDMGAAAYDKDDDYPEIMMPVAMRVLADAENTRAIVLGKSGNGEAIFMNRFPGIRAAVYHGGNLEIVRLSRQHNNSNVLSLAGGFVNEEEVKEAVKIWIATPFSGEERHIKRNNMLDNIE